MVKLIQPAPGPIGKGFGWRHDPPDGRDFQLSQRMSIKQASALPRMVKFPDDKMPPVRDQHNTSACVGFSVASVVSYLRRVDADHHNTDHSPLFTYYMARLLEDEVNKAWTKIDAGAYIRLALKAIHHYGIPPESKWPFIPDKINKSPITSAFKQATRWKLGGYYQCHSAVEIMNALAKGYPVVGGITCYRSMFTSAVTASGDIPLPLQNDTIAGYHAIWFFGYNQDTGRADLFNSWGDWGRKGCGTVALSIFDNRAHSDDLWALVGESDETNAAIRKSRT